MRRSIYIFGVAMALLASSKSLFIYADSNPPRRVQQEAFKTASLPLGGIHVQGNRLTDAIGTPVILRGGQIEGALNVAMPTPDQQTAYQNFSTTFTTMSSVWNMNALRLPTSNWIWSNDPQGYLDMLDQIVQLANSSGLIVVIDLHDDDRTGSPFAFAPPHMPRQEYADYWSAVAARFKDNPNVIFDVMNEPALLGAVNEDTSDFAWNIWLHGGVYAGQPVMGMQSLVDAVRAAGANQVVMVEGLGFGTTFNNIGSRLINDNSVVYEVHDYGLDGDFTVKEGRFGFMSSRFPVFVGEWGFTIDEATPTENNCPTIRPDVAPHLVTNFLGFMAAHNISWTANGFSLHKMILDYSNFTPTRLDIPWTCGDRLTAAGIGTMVKQFLTGESDLPMNIALTPATLNISAGTTTTLTAQVTTSLPLQCVQVPPLVFLSAYVTPAPGGVSVVIPVNSVSVCGGSTNLSVTIPANAPPATYNVVVIGVEAGSVGTGTAGLVLAGPPIPDFSLNFGAPTVNAAAGTKVVITVNIVRINGFTGKVTVSAPASIPKGIVELTDQVTTTGTSASFKFKIKGSVAAGSQQLVFTAQDDSGRSRSAVITLVVQ